MHAYLTLSNLQGFRCEALQQCISDLSSFSMNRIDKRVLKIVNALEENLNKIKMHTYELRFVHAF